MSRDDLEPLALGARRLGLQLTDAQLARFARFRHELLDWNTRVNLTAITDPGLVLTRHFLDALTLVLALPPSWRERPLRVIDIGAGAGLPGLALKIVFPHWQLAELDSVGKKTRFVAHVTDVLGFDGVRVLTARAEECAREVAHRGQYDLAVARAVAPLRVLVEYMLPFCRIGGVAIAMKKGDVAEEIAQGRRAAGQLGGQLEPPVAVPSLPDLDDDRVLIPCRKVRPTPPQFPRAPGIPSKRPL